MRVLHINCTYYREHFRTMVRVQREMGMDSRVLYYTYLKSVPIRNISLEEKQYVSTMKSKNFLLRTNYLTLQRMEFVWREIKKKNEGGFEADLLHAHKLFTDGYIARKINMETQVPYIVGIRNTDVNDKRRWRNKRQRDVALDILMNARKIVLISFKALKRLKKLAGENYCDFERKVEVIPNGIDEFWFQNSYNKVGKDITKKLRILTVGDINKNKNQLIVVEAIESFRKNGVDMYYDIVGNIRDYKYADKIKKKSFVSIMPFMKKEELLNKYREADIFILLSKSETFGLVYPEALSQGVPIIYSKEQGFDGYYDDGTIGYRCCPDSLEEVKEVISKMMKDYNVMIKDIHGKIDMFSWENVNLRYKEIYRMILV